MHTIVVTCIVREFHLPMGEDNLILVRGDRLLVSERSVGSGGRRAVYSVNGHIVPTFYIPSRTVKAITKEGRKNGK